VGLSIAADGTAKLRRHAPWKRHQARCCQNEATEDGMAQTPARLPVLAGKQIRVSVAALPRNGAYHYLLRRLAVGPS
jgi:hypothetical protein